MSIDPPDQPALDPVPLRSSRALAAFLSFLLAIAIALVAASGERGQLVGYLLQPDRNMSRDVWSVGRHGR